MKNIKQLLCGLAIAATAFSAQAINHTSQDADVKEFKSFAQLRMLHENGSSDFCGGSILSDTLILTAAHCLFEQTKDVVYNDPDDMFSGILEPAEYSLINLDNVKVTVKNTTAYDVAVSELKAVKNLFVHSEFKQKQTTLANDTDQRLYDIAIIELETPISTLDNISTILLPTDRGYNTNANTLDLVGLGSITPFVSNKPETLKHGIIKFSTDSDCLTLLEAPIIEDLLLCGDRSDSSFGAQGSGDSGSPLFYTVSGIQYQVGIVNSNGVNSDYFTEVFNYLNWIENVSNGACDNGLVTSANPSCVTDRGNSNLVHVDGADIDGIHSQGDNGYVASDNDYTPPTDGDSGNTDDSSTDSSTSSGGSTSFFGLFILGLFAFSRKQK